MASFPLELNDSLQLDPKTRFALMRFDRRRRRLLLIRAVMIGIATFVACMLMIVTLDYLFFLNDKVRWLLSLLGYLVTLLTVWFTGMNRFANQDIQQLARQLEAADPRVREDLLSAVELSDPSRSNGSKTFVDTLQSSVAKRVATVDVRRLLPIKLIQRWISTGVSIAVICSVISLIPSLHFARRLGRAALPGVAIQRASQTMITIMRPEPATGFVAEGDVVAIVAEISGKPADSVTLRWREQGGETGQSRMLARGKRASFGESMQTDATDPSNTPLYAANLSFGDRVIQYQLTAGDAITLWHTLTPLPRPRTEQFEIRYHFPQYAKLDDQVETSSHGDLQALADSTAEVTVTFDQPVSEAMIRYVGRDLEFPMTAVDSTKRMYRISVPIRTSEQYQVDAVSMESGLGNPFSPVYSISPILDAPPTVQWTHQQRTSMLAGPLEAPSLSVSIQDDMPIASLVQEHSVNGQALVQRTLEVENPKRAFEHTWDWDLTSLTDPNGEPIRLNPGDIVRTRVIVTDRRGHQANSTILDVLIADEGFDSQRHLRLTELAGIARELRQWIRQGDILANQTSDAAQESVDAPQIDRDERIASWSAESSRIVQRIAAYLQSSRAPTESSNLELLGLSVLHLNRQLKGLSQELVWQRQANENGDKTDANATGRDIRSRLKTFQKDAQRTNQMIENFCAISVTLGIANDATLLKNSMLPIAKSNSSVSAGRLPRYLQVANDRLKTINEIVDKQSELLPDSTRRQLQGDGWTGWSNQWTTRLEDAVRGNSGESTLRRTANDFYQELSSHVAHSLVDGRLASTNATTTESVRQQIGSLREKIEQLAEIGEHVTSTGQSIGREKTPVKARDSKHELAILNQEFDAGRAELEKRIVDETDIQRQRPVADLRYAADLGLLLQAIKTVSVDGYQPYQDISANEVYEILADSIEVIESLHHVSRLHRQLMSLRDAERDFVDNAESKILHAFWLDQYRVEMAEASKRLQKQKLMPSAVRSLSEAGNNDDFTLAKSRIDGRRWSNDPPLSAFRPLESLVSQVDAALAELQPDVLRARESILRFVKTLSEQAREAAVLAAEAAARSEAERDADQAQVESLAKQQREAEAAAKETVDRLHDRANTADLTSETQRELAHDADLAAAAVESAMRRAQTSMQEAKTEPAVDARRQDMQDNQEALSELSETLNRVAEHFEKADQDEDPSASREALRDAIEQSQLREEAEQRRRRAEAIAKAAQSDPEEMLKRLESELKKNEVMQNELSDIASRTMDAALNKLRQASNQEQAVQRSLQRSDPAMTELKKRMGAAMKQMSARVDALDVANMDAAQHAGDLSPDGRIRGQLDRVRTHLQQAVSETQSVGGEQTLLSELSEAAQQLAKDLLLASKAIDEVSQDVANQPASKDPLMSPLQTIQRLQQIDNERRNILIRAITAEQRAWTNVVRETGPRLQQAQRQQRDAKQTIAGIESQTKVTAQTDEPRAELEDAKRKLELATKAVDEARKTNEFASQMETQAAQRARKLRTENRPELDMDHPVNESVRYTLDVTNAEIEAIQAELSNWQQLAEERPPLQATSDEASRLIDRQRNVEADVADAGEDVRRAGRHEQRLEKTEIAEAIQQVADAVTQEALPAAEEAHRSLQRASKDAAQTSSANDDLQTAAQEIDRTAGLLQELLGGHADQQATSDSSPRNADQDSGDQNSADQGSGEPSALSEEQSKQLAKTLDELDRAMLSSQSQRPSSEQMQDSDSQSASSESTASSQGEPPSDAQPSGSPPQSAADASPTLASMLESEQQNAARQRRGEKPSNARAGKPNTNPQGEEPSEGEMSLAGLDDPALDSHSIKRAKENWGELRQQAPEDVLESEWSTLSPQYRREVSAYFRAIAQRSVEESQP